MPQIQEKTSVRRKKADGGLFSGVEGRKCLGKLGRPERPREGVMRRQLCRAAEHRADHIRPYGMTAAGTGGRTLCAPTEKGIPNRWDCTKGGGVRPLLGSTPNRGPVVAALYKGGCVGAAMSRPPFQFSALSVGAGPRPACRIAGKPDAEKNPCGRMVSVPAGDETGKHRADYIRPCGVTAAGIRGRTLCAPTKEGAPNRWAVQKGGGCGLSWGVHPIRGRLWLHFTRVAA